MRISDLISDVCSSDLHLVVARARRVQAPGGLADQRLEAAFHMHVDVFQRRVDGDLAFRELLEDLLEALIDGLAVTRDRKSVVEGKSVSVRVDLGGRRISKKKSKNI